ncbi:MAG: hypothetical protein AAF569_02180 [Pseudomonadota bacterium]
MQDIDLSLATDFFGAARELQRRINHALSQIRGNLYEKHKIFLKEAEISVLQLVYDLRDTSHNPSEIAELGNYAGSAIPRVLSTLEGAELIKLEKEGKKLTKVTLTPKGLEIGEFVQGEMNRAAKEITLSMQKANSSKLRWMPS